MNNREFISWFKDVLLVKKDEEEALVFCSSVETELVDDGPGLGCTSPHLSRIVERITISSKFVKCSMPLTLKCLQ